jgi:hypothetical protein
MAAMILLLIASLAGVLLFTTSIRASNEQGALIRTQYKNEGDSAQERYEILNAEYNEDEGKIIAWIYNYGNLDCKIISIYVNQKPATNQNPDPALVNTGDVTKISIVPAETLGTNYKITCISERGVKNESTWSK